MSLPTTFKCIYCAKSKPIEERSFEHIWPQVFGGDCAPPWFMTNDACERCNSLMGQFVDAEFARTQFGTQIRFQAALPFIDTAVPSPMPLVFMGVQRVGPSLSEICESWVGPRGEAVYYFHKADGDDYATYAAGDPLKRKKDPGRVYFGLTRPNTFWLLTAIRSVRHKFPKAEMRLLTQIDDQRIVAMFAPESERSVRDRAYVTPLWERRTQDVVQTVNVDYGVRFQSKLALGFGNALFNNAFNERPYAQTLRDGLWHRHGRGEAPPLIGKNFWGDAKGGFTEQFTNAGAFTLLFSRSTDGAWLSVFMPTGNCTHTQILPNEELVRSAFFYDMSNNFVVLIFPAIKRFFGPVPAFSYLEHQCGSRPIPELAEIEGKRKKLAQIEAEVARYDIPVEMAA